jgi:predicted  nucleic acid-binding Zn-ribbon protein
LQDLRSQIAISNNRAIRLQENEAALQAESAALREDLKTLQTQLRDKCANLDKAESELAMLQQSHGREKHVLEQENLELYQDMDVLKREMIEVWFELKMKRWHELGNLNERPCACSCKHSSMFSGLKQIPDQVWCLHFRPRSHPQVCKRKHEQLR